VRRYNWPDWTDGAVWEIRQGDDYDVATENMRVNLHTKARQIGAKVKTAIVREGDSEGLRFQFLGGTQRQSRGEESQSDDGSEKLDKAWDREMHRIYDDAKAINYNASGFMQLLGNHGAISAAKILINKSEPSDGFTELWKLGRLDISVEARALKPEFRELFSSAELAICRKRLAAYEWDQRPPWHAPA
jgi:hypothetical protein